MQYIAGVRIEESAMDANPRATALNQRSAEECRCVWWSFRTGLEKCLIFSWTFVSLLFFGLCFTVIALAVISHNSKSKGKINY